MKRFILFLALASSAFAVNTPDGPMTQNTNTHQVDQDATYGSGHTLGLQSGAILNWATGAVFSGDASAFRTATGTEAQNAVLDALVASNAIAALNITGTAGGGYITLPMQSSAPSAPTSGNIRIYADANNKFAWIGASGYTRSFDGTLSASRTFTLPDTSGNVVLDSATQTLTNKSIDAGQLTGSINAARIPANAVANSQAAQMAAGTYKGNSTSSTANAQDLTAAQMQSGLNFLTVSNVPSPYASSYVGLPLLDANIPKLVDTANATSEGLTIGVRRNVAWYSEDFTWSYWVANSATKNTSDTITWNGITLTHINGINYFYGTLHINEGSGGWSGFTASTPYLISWYVRSNASYPYPNSSALNNLNENFVSTAGPASSSSPGFGKRMADSQVRRVWQVIYATSSTLFDWGGSPVTAWGSGTTSGSVGITIGAAPSSANDLYVGGFQIEPVSTSALKDAVCFVGDSTVQGSSGGYDNVQALESASYAEALLNVSFFNRGVGGYKTSDIISNWSTTSVWGSANGSPHDVSPRCRYCLIEAGINDITNGGSAATVETNLTSIASLATGDGMIPIFMTVTPLGASNVAYDSVRQTVNAWIRTQKNFIDAALVVQDPVNNALIRQQTNWDPGDNSPHYAIEAKRALGAAIAQWPGWSFTKPSTYQKITASTFTPASALAAHVGGAGVAPTYTAYAGAGTSPTISLLNAHDRSFTLSVVTGSSPSSSTAIATVNYAAAYANNPHFSLTAANAAACALSGSSAPVPSSNTTAFYLTSGSTALTASTTYLWEVTISQ